MFFFNDTATTEIYTYYTLFPYTTLFRSKPSTSLKKEQVAARTEEMEMLAIGLMSGTSRDGMDAALIETDGEGANKGVAFHAMRSEEHTSELQSLMRISYAVFCLKQKKNNNKQLPRLQH